ncbi:hypothetical protein FA95DRAFT_1653355 [Auriscalpium vulgare]|uniref:Uncharacterized protein n=1 Tax=Auriscalpium vulgare TaxID=40419 RepID=A0ACB8RYG1_9AGAM|nr:hypothetical protein FA95DRAFT_1653355 [Auriscalpium vulgare]
MNIALQSQPGSVHALEATRTVNALARPDLPAPVQRMFAMLEASYHLPKTLLDLKNVVNTTSSTEVQALFSELLSSDVPSCESPDASLDLLLRRTAILALYNTWTARLSLDCEPTSKDSMPKTSFWASLLNTGLGCTLLRDVRYALSHSQCADSRGAQSYGVATLVGVRVLTDYYSEVASSHASTAPSLFRSAEDRRQRREVVRLFGLDWAEENDYEWDGKLSDTTVEMEEEPSEPSLSPDERNIHFVADPTYDMDPAVPLFCLAPASAILSAMDSMVRQRWIWGIEEPLLGLCVEPCSLAGQVVVAWLADGPTGTVSFGTERTFYLDDPADTLRLLQSLLRLSLDGSGEVAAHNAPRVKCMASAGKIDLWRAGDERSSFQARIDAWLNAASASGSPGFPATSADSPSSWSQHTDVSDASETHRRAGRSVERHPPTRTLRSSAKDTSLARDPEAVLPRARSSQTSASRGKKVDNPSSDHCGRHPCVRGRSKGNVLEGTVFEGTVLKGTVLKGSVLKGIDEGIVRSMVLFCVRGTRFLLFCRDTSGREKDGTGTVASHYALDRRSYNLPRLSGCLATDMLESYNLIAALPRMTCIEKEFDAMETTLKDLSTSQLWQFHSTAFPLPSTLRVSGERVNLKPQLEEFKGALLQSNNVAPTAVPSMTQNHEDAGIYAFVNSELFVILHTAADAVALAARMGHNYEAETRMLWDRLIFIFFRGNGIAAYLERMLAFPVNPLECLVPRSPATPDSSILSNPEPQTVWRERRAGAVWWNNQLSPMLLNESLLSEEEQAIQHLVDRSNRHLTGEQLRLSSTILDTVRERLHREPCQGKVDVIGALSIHLDGIAPDIVQKLSLVHISEESKAAYLKPAQSHPTSANNLDPDDPRLAMERADTSHKPTPGVPSAFGYVPLLLPVFVMEDKATAETFSIGGYEQTRLYLIASVYFLKALGITNFPVYGLAAQGHEGFLFSATYTTQHGPDPTKECVLILDRCVVGFSLANPLEVFHFCVILQRLATRHAAELKARFEKVKPKLLKTLAEDSAERTALLKWHMPAPRTKEAGDQASQTVQAQAAAQAPSQKAAPMPVVQEGDDSDLAENLKNLAVSS